MFACTNLVGIALVEYITGAERMWCVLHTNFGALLIGNWYRPPDEDRSSVTICKLKSSVSAVIVSALFYLEILTYTTNGG